MLNTCFPSESLEFQYELGTTCLHNEPHYKNLVLGT